MHLENYIFENGRVRRRFVEALSKKEGEGVPMHMLYDWFGSSGVPCSPETGLPYRDTAASVRGPAVADVVERAFAIIWDARRRGW